MEHPGFFERAGPFAVADLARQVGAELGAGGAADALLHDVRALDVAGPGDVVFLDNKQYLPQLATTRAGACLITPALADRVPAHVVRLVTPYPYHAFAKAIACFYPGAMLSRTTDVGLDGPRVHPTAEIEDGVEIEAGAVIGREARVGRGSRIAAGAVLGYRVTFGRDGYVGPGATLLHALVGDRVIIHSGARIGQDGFGFALSPKGHLKVPQVGRVIIQDDVEIGANSTIDRGALKDTVIGEGSKIDNLVQIGHNVVLGRHCVVVAQVGIAGSTELGDFVVMGGQSGTSGHNKIGSGAQIAAQSGVKDDIPPRGRWGGSPARPIAQWAREVAALRLMSLRKKGND
jgi:UDP-3-O-[3-hydroxymyristoyl] glucosamine N-acyltransferase